MREMNTSTPIIVKAGDVPFYKPEGHSFTWNQRLAGPFNGSDNVEFVIGNMKKGGGADRHSHSEVDQLMFMIEGELRVLSSEFDAKLEPNDLIVFLKDVEHEVECLSDTARFVVVYSPPKQRL